MTKRKFKLSRYAKAVVAFLAPVLTTLSTQLSAGLSGVEIARSVVTGMITALVVWACPNAA